MSNLYQEYCNDEVDDEVYFDDQEAWDSLDEAFDDLIERLEKKDKKKNRAPKKMRKDR